MLVNWECLLATIGEGEDVHFVSDDKDYLITVTPFVQRIPRFGVEGL